MKSYSDSESRTRNTYKSLLIPTFYKVFLTLKDNAIDGELLLDGMKDLDVTYNENPIEV
jgi:hypothetical protein